MRKIWSCAFILFLGTSTAVFAVEDDPSEGVHSTLKDQLYVVDSSEMSESDSLNRISGNIDLGFSLPSQSYQSENQGKAGPFARAESMDRSQGY